MSFRRLVPTLALLGIFTMALRVSVDGDTWWHLRAGQWMVENQQILRADPFSLTRQGQPWLYPGWIAQLLMYAVYQALGLPGLNLLTALCVLAAFGMVWRAVDANPLVQAFAFVLGAAASGVYWSARPQILSFALTGAVWLVLQRAERDGARRLLLLLPIFALWSNLHGGFAIGWIVIGAWLVGRFLDRQLPSALRRAASDREDAIGWRHACAALVASVLAVSLNPHGPAMILYPFKTLSISVLQDYIQEWQSPNFHMLEVQPFLWMLMLIGVFLIWSPRKPSWVSLLILGVFGYMGFAAARNIALLGLLGAPILTAHAQEVLAPLLDRAKSRPQLAERLSRALNVLLLVLMLMAAGLKAMTPLSAEFNQAALGERMPVKASGYILAQRLPGALYNSYNWGGYVLWALYPSYLSFVDGRTDLFNDQVLEQYLAIWRAESDWQSGMARWGIKVALVEPDAPIARALRSSGWTAVYEDSLAAVLVQGD